MVDPNMPPKTAMFSETPPPRKIPIPTLSPAYFSVPALPPEALSEV
jgi:hypothetical protein